MRPLARRGWAFSPRGFLRRVVIGAYEDNILFLGSALTFDALLAALPFALLLLAALGYVVHAGDDAMADVLTLVERLLPGSPSAGGPLRPAERMITAVVESRAQLSIYGIPLFLWFATRFFTGARAALNEVFDTSESRSIVVGKAIDLALVLAALVLIIANAVLTVLMADLPWLGRFAAALTTFSLGVVLFFIIYRVAPTRAVRWDTAFVAAVVASLGFEIAKRLYGLYLVEFTSIDRLISNANAIALLLLVVWLYAMACIFLLGAEVAETYDLMRRQREQRAILA